MQGTLLAGRYEIAELLGTGGMADVHAALDRKLERSVAVKTLRPAMAARSDVRRRFETEARAAASISHPNAVAVFDTGEDDGVPYIVMERLPGETLADRICALCLADSRVAAAAVTVHKPQAPISHAFSDVSVTLHRSRPTPARRVP